MPFHIFFPIDLENYPEFKGMKSGDNFKIAAEIENISFIGREISLKSTKKIDMTPISAIRVEELIDKNKELITEPELKEKRWYLTMDNPFTYIFVFLIIGFTAWYIYSKFGIQLNP
jgi:hypothetical protein